MVRTIMTVALVAGVTVLAGGCAGKKDKAARGKDGRIPLDRSVVTHVAAAKAPPAPVATPVATPVLAPAPAAAPIATAAPAAPTPAVLASPQFTPVDPTDFAAGRPSYAAAGTHAPAQPASARLAAGPSLPAAGQRYQVRKGDTLFGIARTRYGSGGQWQRIASANPGLSPATLQAGAMIVVP